MHKGEIMANTAIEVLKHKFDMKKRKLENIDENLLKLKDEEEHILKCYNLDMERIHKAREGTQLARQRFYKECNDLESTIQTLENISKAKLEEISTKSEEIYNRHTCIGINCKHPCHFTNPCKH